MQKNIILSYDDKEKNKNKYLYIYFKENLDEVEEGESKRQIIYDGYGSDEAKKEGLEFIVDFDQDNKIIGIEIISSKSIIPENLS